MVLERFDVKRGGSWRFVEHAPDGRTHGFSGRFRALVPPERIVQTFEWDGMPGHVIVETMTLEVDDLPAPITELKSKGITFQSDLIRGPRCRMAIGLDSEGNSLLLHQLDRASQPCANPTRSLDTPPLRASSIGALILPE